jgi:hypothetical protein
MEADREVRPLLLARWRRQRPFITLRVSAMFEAFERDESDSGVQTIDFD